MMGNDFFTHPSEWNGIKILGITHFNAAKLESHHGRKVTACFLYVTATIFPLPCKAIEWGILMSIHNTFLCQRIQTLYQFCSRCLFTAPHLFFLAAILLHLTLYLVLRVCAQCEHQQGNSHNLFHIIKNLINYS